MLYLFNAGTFLVDKSVFDWSPAAAIAASLGFLAAFWVAYDLICRWVGEREGAVGGDAIVGALVFVFVSAASYLACQLFAGREDAGSEWPEDGLFDVAKTVHFRARYANGVELECITRKDNVSCRFEGTEGWVETGYGGFSTEPASLKTSVIGSRDNSLGASTNHFRNFLDCIKTRAEPIAPVEVGHRSATICHIANIAMQLKRKLRWNPTNESFVGNDEANKRLARPLHNGWKLADV